MIWPTIQIGELVTVRGGGTPRRDREEFFQGNIPWVTPKDMKMWNIHGAQISISREAVESSAAHLVDRDCVLIVVRSGILKHSLPVAINRVPVTINQDMKALSCDGRLQPDYLARALQASAPTILSWVRATTADNFSISNLKNSRIPFPPLPEQRRIAAILDQADALRAKRRAALAQMNGLARALFVEMFGEEQGIESRWPVRPLAEILEFLTSGSRGWASHYADQGHLFLRIQNVLRDKLDLSDVAYVNAPETAEARRTRVQPGDVLLSITADLGRTAVIPDDFRPAYINQHLAILRQTCLHPLFLSHFLSTPFGQEQITRRNKQGVKAGLNFDDVRSIRVPLPPRDLQDAYAERRTHASALATRYLQSSETFDALFASIQHRAFRGEL